MKSYRPLPRFSDLVPKLRHKDDAKSKVALIVTSYLRLVLREKKNSMRNTRALKLLSKPLERDVLVKNSAREFAMLACEQFS